MNERLRQLRAALNLSQKEFSQKISVGYSTLAQFETGARQIKDIHIARICEVFGVNEHWLRTGEGEMFTQTDRSLIDRVCKTYALDSAGRTLLETLLALPAGYAQMLLDVAHRLVEHTDATPQPASEIDIDAEVESYRQELLQEKKAVETSSVSGDTAASDA